jgi:hypothetical protein
MQIDVLSHEEVLTSGYTHKITIPYTDIAVETSGTAFEIFPKLTTSTPTIPAGSVVTQAALLVTTAFTFAPGTLAAELGDGGDVDRFVASSDIKTAAWYAGVPANIPHTYVAADTIDVEVTAGAGALTSVTAGELVVLLAIRNGNKVV